MFKTALLTGAAMLFAGQLFASHPLITDDTGTQGRGKFQLELNGEHMNDRGMSHNGIWKADGGQAATSLSWGLSNKIDLTANMHWQSSHLEENGVVTNNENGLGDSSLELKWRFLENIDNGLSFALKPGISLPTGNDQKGLGNGKVSGDMVLISTYEGKLGALHGNVGYYHNAFRLDRDKLACRSDIWQASLAAELNMTTQLCLVADVGVKTNQNKSSDTAPVFLIGGLIYSINDKLDLDVGVKDGLNKAETDSTVMAGMALKF